MLNRSGFIPLPHRFPGARREWISEWMDAPDLSVQQHDQALSGLRRINRVTQVAKPIAAAVADLARTAGAVTNDASNAAPVRILDVACGGGDLAIALSRYLRRRSMAVSVVGVDLNPTAIRIANEQLSASRPAQQSTIRFEQLDVLRDRLPSCDVVVSSLFLHHLRDGQVQQLLQRLRDVAKLGGVISDLRRSRYGYALAWFGSRLLTRSPVVHYDGPVSVRRAFTRTELQQLAIQANLPDSQVTRHWPERLLLRWTRS